MSDSDLRESYEAFLDQVEDAVIQARGLLDPDGGPGEPPDPPDPPDPPGDDLLPEADQRAVSRMRQGQQIQLIPRNGGKWLVEYRTNDKPFNVVGSGHRSAISAALADLEPLPKYLKIPDEGSRLDIDEQQAILDFAPLSKTGRRCSIRWEKNKTAADTNWAGKEEWSEVGLIVFPSKWLVGKW